MHRTSRPFLRQFFKRLLGLLLILLLSAAVVRLFHAAQCDSQDFRVYFRAVQNWWQGKFPYAIDPADHGFVFKYPPWMLPLFLPFAALDFELSKLIWAVLELGAILYSLDWLLKNGVSRPVLIFMTLLFWYIWLAHFYAGQITLLLLACGLWAMSAKRRNQAFPQAALAALFASKIFSISTLAGTWRRLFRWKVIAVLALLFSISHGILIAQAYRMGAPPWTEISKLYDGFRIAASSGATGLGAEAIRGQGNHGFPALLLRIFDPEAHSTLADLGASLFFALLLGKLWSSVSRGLEAEKVWAGWLALGVIAHPLAWHHSFVMTFPLCAFGLQAAQNISKKSPTRNLALAGALLGTALIALCVPQVLGKSLVKPFELAANKSWGVVLIAWVLVRTQRDDQ